MIAPTEANRGKNGEARPVRAARILRVLSWALFGLLLYWVYGHRPLVAEPWQWADDGLYLRQAEALIRWINGAQGPWMGAYDPVLLSKAPFFAIWMATLYVCHLPLRMAEFCMLLALPWIFRAAVRPMIELRGWPLIAVTLLLVGLPFLPQDLRLLRSALQAALGGGCLISAVGVILRVRAPLVPLAGWSGLLGSYFALSYLNREEAIWLSPVVACAIGSVLINAGLRRQWRPAAVAAASLAIAFAVPTLTVMTLNYQGYGLAVTTVRRAPAFTRAHQVMTSLEPASREHYVPIRTDTRLKAYILSPSFARLKSFLEGPESDSIATNPGHLSLNARPPGTREFFVSNFEFALRDAAFHAGARTASDSEKLFGEIERELKAAVAAGTISAGNSGPAVLAAPLAGDYPKIARQTFVSLRKLYSLDSMAIPVPGPSSGDPHELQRVSALTNMPLAPTQENIGGAMPEVAGGIRRTLFLWLKRIELLGYLAGTGGVLFFATRTAIRHPFNPSQVERAFAGLVLCGSLFAFSLSMAVVDVLGFPLLQWGASYNSLGYIPLSVLGAFGVTLLVAWHKETFVDARTPAASSR